MCVYRSKNYQLVVLTVQVRDMLGETDEVKAAQLEQQVSHLLCCQLRLSL